MPGFEDGPKPGPADEEEKPLALETPEQEAERLAKSRAALELMPGESEEGTRNYLEAQERAADAALAAEQVQEADEARAQEVLRRIQDTPVIPELQVVEKASAETSSAQEEPVSGFKKILQRLKFWEKDPEEKRTRTQEQFRSLLAKGQIDKLPFPDFDPKKLEAKTGIRSVEEWDALMGPMVEEYSRNLIRSGDGKALKKLLSSDAMWSRYGQDNLLPTEGLAAEELHNPEIVRVVLEEISEWAQGFNVNGADTLVDAYGKMRNMYVAKGLVTPEEVNALPAVKNAVRKEIKQRAKLVFSEYNSKAHATDQWVSIRQQYLATGVFSESEFDSLSGVGRFTQ